METILPIIIAIAIFAFQAYSNYQKEQEKAKKRNPGQPRIPDASGEYPFNEHPSMDEPSIPDYWEERTPKHVPQAGAQTLKRQQQIPVKQQIPVQQAFDEYSGVVDVEEVRRARKARQREVIPHRLVAAEEEDAGLAGNQEFDLRDAVIKSAILERPYQ